MVLRLNEGTYVQYDKADGSTGRFNLDFTDTRDLFREIEDLCGYDFKQQVEREFHNWYEEMATTAKQMNENGKEVLEHLDEVIDILKKIAKGKAVDKEELQDAIDELDDVREEYNDYTDWASEFNYILTGKGFND